MDTKIRQQLERFEKEALLDLIERLYGRDRSLDAEIDAFAARGTPSAHGQELRRWIRSWTDRQRFVSYSQSFDMAREIEDVAGELASLLESGEPASSFALVEQFLAAGEEILLQADDSSGAISGALREASVLWLRAARRCRDDGQQADWIQRIEELMETDGYGLLDPVLPQASILLSEAELHELAERYEARARAEGDGSLSTTVKLGSLAWALGEPEIYVRSIQLRSPEPNELQKSSIADCYLELGDPAGALTWLEGNWQREEGRRLQQRASAFEALGRRDDLVATRRQIWEHLPSPDTLEQLLALLPQTEQSRVKAEAFEHASTMGSLEKALEILLYLGKQVDAEELLLSRIAELSGDRYGSLSSMLEPFEAAGRPLACSLIYRALLDSILERGYSRAYHHAARYYRQLDALANKVSDWRGAENHGAYIDGIRSQHYRKHSFWSRVGGAPKTS